MDRERSRWPVVAASLMAYGGNRPAGGTAKEYETTCASCASCGLAGRFGAGLPYNTYHLAADAALGPSFLVRTAPY